MDSPKSDTHSKPPTLDHLSTAIVVLDAQLCVVHTNTALENLLGIGTNQLTGNAFTDYLANPNTHRELFQVLLTGVSHTHRATELYVAGRGTVIVDFTTSLINDNQLLLELQSVDRFLQINREDTLLSVQAASQELVRGMAHEVKNPLGGIKGAAQLLALELPDEPDKYSEYTDLIVAEANRLSHLVDQLLGPARALQLNAINVHQITEHVAALIAAESQGTDNLNIQRDYDPSIPELFADDQQLIQAVLNIARNAMQALTSQTRRHAHNTITLRTRIQRHFTIGKTPHRMVLQLDIEDNGPGIASNIAERIFYPMISGHAKGSGLGLHIAQTIISRHHGLIECNSRTGKTCFSIYLPLQQPQGQNHE